MLVLSLLLNLLDSFFFLSSLIEMSLYFNFSYLVLVKKSLVFGLMIMAESFLFSIVDSLIAKLASQLYEEASWVMGLYHHLQEFTRTLSLVKVVLLDAEQKQEHNHELREWLKQLKRVFSDAQDVLDEFECQTLQN